MADPVVHITAGVPDSGTGNITTLGQTLLDGANVTHGALADAAVAAGAAGSFSAKLRTISRDIVANIVLAAGSAIIGLVKLSDGTNTAAVKAASTAAAATDPAVVVALSPNGVTRGAGAADASTVRVTMDSGQIGSLVTGDFTKATATVPVELPSDQAPIATKDAGPNWTSVWGVSGVPVTTATTFSTTAVTDAPTAGQKLCIDDIIVSADAATKITLLEETSGTVMFGPWYFPANSGPMQISVRGKKKLATADKKLVATSVGAANMTVQVGYHSEA